MKNFATLLFCFERQSRTKFVVGWWRGDDPVKKCTQIQASSSDNDDVFFTRPNIGNRFIGPALKLSGRKCLCRFDNRDQVVLDLGQFFTGGLRRSDVEVSVHLLG